jgi:hypothetical protein
MSLAKRLESVEDSLTPKEAVILWMREAHQFGSLEAYCRWLLDQPDDVYPLVKMPAQVVAAVRAAHKGVPEAKLRDELYRAQKDVTFLYFLHKQANMRALMDYEALQLRVIILLKEIRALVNEKHGLDQMRLGRVDLAEKKHPRPGKVEQSAKALYQAHVETWPREMKEILARILTFLSAARMISRRYFAGEDILFPDTRENLDWNLGTIANLTDVHMDFLLGGSPQSDDDFREYVLALVNSGAEVKKRSASGSIEKGAPDVSPEARLLAEQWILMAKSETLEKLGEHREAENLAVRLMREYAS